MRLAVGKRSSLCALAQLLGRVVMGPAGDHPGDALLVHGGSPSRGLAVDGVSTFVDMMGLVSILVNIDGERYPTVMARTPRSTTLDPDVRLLAALADPTRLAIVRQLAIDAETCACDFTACCDVGQPTVSHHLRVLREAGVVASERRGQWVFYRLTADVSERLTAIGRALVPGGLIPVSDLTGRTPTPRPARATGVSARA